MYDISAQNTLYESHMHYGKRCGPSFAANNGLLRVARIPVNYLFGKSLEIKFFGHLKRHQNYHKYAQSLRRMCAY